MWSIGGEQIAQAARLTGGGSGRKSGACRLEVEGSKLGEGLGHGAELQRAGERFDRPNLATAIAGGKGEGSREGHQVVAHLWVGLGGRGDKRKGFVGVGQGAAAVVVCDEAVPAREWEMSTRGGSAMGLAVEEEEEIGHGGAYPRTADDVARGKSASRGGGEVPEALCAAHGSERGLGDVIPTARELAGMGIRGGEVGSAVWQGDMVPARGWWGPEGGREVKRHSNSGTDSQWVGNPAALVWSIAPHEVGGGR
ncbi:spidroin-1-like [Panicum virgatum]|uniref:spidroin-1-like n=1 Tax=Panicum virgatum TaxID=38727 RepID=UPI0019D609A6|nr:spidroin-1-like [Panicum virgatum]